MFKVNNKVTRTTSLTSFWCLYCWLWTYFTLRSSVFIANLEQVNADWEFTYLKVKTKLTYFVSAKKITNLRDLTLELRKLRYRTCSFHFWLSYFIYLTRTVLPEYTFRVVALTLNLTKVALLSIAIKSLEDGTDRKSLHFCS